MDVRSHEVIETVVTKVPSKYLIVEHNGHMYIVPDECLDDLTSQTVGEYSVLTVCMKDDHVTKSRFF